ncbi:hypothetical protein [Streptomyces subrutilus]|uniref:hypothetical protein n=1 Tax=Streptomyces subrutilus TaxID=36818 RepID=UPI0014307849|nr:hypothetical protein [Streptomyces subrutilus]
MTYLPQTPFGVIESRVWKCPERGCRATFRSANPTMLDKLAQLHAARVHQGKTR